MYHSILVKHIPGGLSKVVINRFSQFSFNITIIELNIFYAQFMQSCVQNIFTNSLVLATLIQLVQFWKLGQKLHYNYIAEVLTGPCVLHAKKNIVKPLIHPLTIINSTWYPINTIVTTQNYPSNIKKLHLLPHQTPFFQITTTSKGHFLGDSCYNSTMRITQQTGTFLYCCSDMENVMSVGSAACVKFQSWDKFLALNIVCFVVNVLPIALLNCFFFFS